MSTSTYTPPLGSNNIFPGRNNTNVSPASATGPHLECHELKPVVGSVTTGVEKQSTD